MTGQLDAVSGRIPRLTWSSNMLLSHTAVLFWVYCVCGGCSISRTNVDVAVSANITLKNELINRIGIVTFDFDRPVSEQIASGGFVSRPKNAGEIVADGISDLPLLLGYDVIERRRLSTLLQENDLRVADLLNKDTGAELGKTLGVDALILGCVSEYSGFSHSFGYGRQVSFTAKCVHLETGEVLWTVSAWKEGPEGSTEMISQICKEAAERLRRSRANKTKEAEPGGERNSTRGAEYGVVSSKVLRCCLDSRAVRGVRVAGDRPG